MRIICTLIFAIILGTSSFAVAHDDHGREGHDKGHEHDDDRGHGKHGDHGHDDDHGPKPTQAPTAVPTPVPTAIPTVIPTAIPTAVPTAVPTEIPTAIPTPVPTATLVPTAVSTLVPTPVPTVQANFIVSAVPSGQTLLITFDAGITGVASVSYGPTASYGSVAPASPAGGSSYMAVLNVAGLATVHYRCSVNGVVSADQVYFAQ